MTVTDPRHQAAIIDLSVGKALQRMQDQREASKHVIAAARRISITQGYVTQSMRAALAEALAQYDAI